MRAAPRAAAWLAAAVLALPAAAIATEPRPPDPWPLLFAGVPRTPPLDAPFRPLCTQPERVARLLDGARRAVSRSERLVEREHLATIVAHGEDELTRACAALASARLALSLGLQPEAAADAVWAREQAEILGDAGLLAAARFARAEAFFLAGRTQASLALYDELATSLDPVVSASARLRVAEAQQERGDLEPARAAFRELLGPGSPLVGIPLGAFALRAAEAAWAAGDAGEAARWVEQALGEKLDADHWTVAMIRRGDLQLATGRSEEGERTLAAVAGFAPGGPADLLTRVRRVSHALAHPPVDTQELQTQLAPAMASDTMPLASYARAVGAEVALASKRAATAFEELVPLLTEPRSVERLGLAQQLDDVVLRLVGDGRHCEAAIARLDPQRALVVRSVSRPEPLAALGDCYQKVGLAEPALAILRVVTERFGPETTALPFARSALRAGSYDVAASAARDRLATGTPDADAWRLLLAEVELARQDPKSAEELLLPLVTDGPLAVRTAAVGLLAQAAGAGQPTGIAIDALVRAIEAASEAAWKRDGETLGDAALGTANLLRREGRLEQALALYALASEHDASKAARAESLYWRGRMAPAPETRRAQLRESVAADGGPWSALAKSRLSLLDLGRKPMDGGKS